MGGVRAARFAARPLPPPAPPDAPGCRLDTLSTMREPKRSCVTEQLPQSREILAHGALVLHRAGSRSYPAP